jgi:RNA 3'-terminal phosphate cyclase
VYLMNLRSVLDDHLPDVYVFTDHTKGKESGLSPGFSLTLTAETTSGCVLVAEKCSDKGALPEVPARASSPCHPLPCVWVPYVCVHVRVRA